MLLLLLSLLCCCCCCDGGIPRELADVFPIVLINTDLSTNLPIWFTVSLCAEGCPFSLNGRICLWEESIKHIQQLSEIKKLNGPARVSQVLDTSYTVTVQTACFYLTITNSKGKTRHCVGAHFTSYVCSTNFFGKPLLKTFFICANGGCSSVP